jgi:hypothetical protein
VTFYSIALKPGTGGTLKVFNYQFTGSGTQDLSQMTPYTGSSSITPPPPNAVVTNPSGQQTISTFPLSALFIGSFIGTLGVNVPTTGPTPAFDLSKGSKQKYTLTTNISPTFINTQDGQLVILIFVQDGTGGRTVTFPGNVIGAMSQDPTANAITAQIFITDGSNLLALGGGTVN